MAIQYILLPSLTALRFSGADARSFLQGQLTCDIRQITPERGQWGGYCSYQGRMLAFLLLFEQDQEIIALLPKDIAADIALRLKKYVIRSKVTISQESHPIYGIMHSVGGVSDFTVAGNRIKIPGLLANQERWLALAPEGTVTTEQTALDWQQADIQAGIPHIEMATQEHFIPQMLNMDLLRAISFDKGCYAGQEIVVRTSHLGQIKRRMYLFSCDTKQAKLAAGARLIHPATGQAVAEVVRFANDQLLAVVRQEFAEQDLHTEDGEPCTFLKVPDAL